jgi:hypothetical protein
MERSGGEEKVAEPGAIDADDCSEYEQGDNNRYLFVVRVAEI